MRPNGWYLLVPMLLLPHTSWALQLRWSDGSTDLSFVSTTRCTLEVRADSLEIRLPGEWRLLWLADSAGVHLVAGDPAAACETGIAQVASLDPPTTPADSCGHQIAAHFCSVASEPPGEAHYIFDQPGGSHARFKVVALDPTDPDSDRVVESNEVTLNGGVSGDYSPIVLRASRSHPTADLRIEAVGIGLSNAPRVEIAAPDTAWRLTLHNNGATTG